MQAGGQNKRLLSLSDGAPVDEILRSREFPCRCLDKSDSLYVRASHIYSNSVDSI